MEAYVPARHPAHCRSVETLHAPLSRSSATHDEHGSHRVPRKPVWYVPAAQPSQAKRPAAEANVPAAQPAQVPSLSPSQPAPQTSPDRHALQFLHVVPPLPVWKVPVAHAAQTVAAWAFWNWPLPHLMHALARDPF